MTSTVNQIFPVFDSLDFIPYDGSLLKLQVFCIFHHLLFQRLYILLSVLFQEKIIVALKYLCVFLCNGFTVFYLPLKDIFNLFPNGCRSNAMFIIPFHLDLSSVLGLIYGLLHGRTHFVCIHNDSAVSVSCSTANGLDK